MDQPRRRARGLLALGAAGLLVLGLAACGSDDESGSGDTATTEAADSGTDYGGSTDTTSADAPSDAPAEATAPVIEGFAFEPEEISIEVGEEVTWTNNDGTAHTVTADDESFDSGNLDGGATFSQTFDEAGEFAYHCNIHPQMSGTVSVSD